MKKYAFDTLFLDMDYLRDLSIIAKKENLIEVSDPINLDKYMSLPNRYPNGYKQLLFWLMMYEHVDSTSTEYSWDPFVDNGIIKTDSCILGGYTGAGDDDCIRKAKEIALFYKEDFVKNIIKYLKKTGSGNKKDLYFYNFREYGM